jgi:hypothetical protein
MIHSNNPIILPEKSAPQLIVVVDTEEEFDWSKPPDSNATSVTAISDIYKVQDIFNEYGIVPCYVVDYPVASNEQSVAPLREYLVNGQCEIGAHLQPWVNPPTGEQLTFSNMYPGNLNFEMERDKLNCLKKQIESSFGESPKTYKAGRYGVGVNTTKILQELGFTIDASVCTGFDYRKDGGPNFSNATCDPYWFGHDDSLLEIPLTGGFVGMAGRMSRPLYDIAGHLSLVKARGLLSHLSIVDRLMLSPEGYSSVEHRKLTKHLYSKGLRTFTWNFHSPSVVPGMTMYTQTAKEVSEFLDSFKYYFDFFFGELGGEVTTPSKLRVQLEALK